ncbi:YbcC family protein [Rhizobacter fulvus]
MNAPVDAPLVQAQRLAAHIHTATARIAPTWPLDQFIAVNPYWGWVGQPIADAAATLGTLTATRLTMPREWYRAQWAAGHLQRGHLQAAAVRELDANADAGAANIQMRVDELVAALKCPGAPLARLPLVTDLRDRGAPPRPGLRWPELVTHQISQHCAAFFDRHQATWAMDTSNGLYGSWRLQLDADHGLRWRQGRAALRTRLAALPSAPPDVIAAALDAMAIPEEGRDAYLSAVLMAIGGWAAWCAYLRWQARLRGADDDTIEHLLAIRLTWEWLLFEDSPPGTIEPGWAARWATADAAAQALAQVQRTDWLLQNAAEIAYQQPLIEQLGRALPAAAPTPPAVQALFCIDVRSEVFRRALERTSPAVQTRGFAGFFGLSIAYSPLGSALERPQLPGLLAPAHRVSEEGGGLGQVLAEQRRDALQWRQRWAEFRAAPASAFSFVESMGLLYGAKLLAQSLPSSATPARWEDTGLPATTAAALRPCLPLATDDPAAAAAMARGILGAMGLLNGFAPLVLLVGHGSSSANNPHAAGLDCGACGGQTGEVNARVMADLLNMPAVREHLRELGVEVPAATHFLPALHNTTTDEVLLYDCDTVPAALRAELAQLRGWLDAAGASARAERAESLGLGSIACNDAALKQAVLQRANDWAQVRPEWGLADNAAFIVAPRARTRHLDLAGRSFLHDYDHRLDPDVSVLTLIMTAPMVVTHWINMQYHASTVDNLRYGSGNKTLHNVVGGRVGVFEGNGGDLRIGLPMQSLHDGRTLRHTPLRLSVFIEAPRAAIETVIAGHEIVRQLVGNGWLHLFRIDTQTSAVEQRRKGTWAATANDD